jgi:LPXTG-motif cell wall-anchored protein
VVVPIVGVALLVLAALFFWRRRKQRKDAEENRRKEVEEYEFNPNEDPTLPAIGVMKNRTGDGPFETREDDSGYRGWGATAAGSSGRQASTTLSGGAVGMAHSEGTSPSHAPVSDTRSGDTLIGSPSGRPTSGSEEVLGAMGPSSAGNRGGDMHRGPSNASSSYSAANRSDASGEAPLPGGAYGAAQYYAGDTSYGGPYADASAGRAEMSGQPVIRDNLARRATRIENPSHFPTQASAGISQNF